MDIREYTYIIEEDFYSVIKHIDGLNVIITKIEIFDRFFKQVTIHVINRN